MLKREAHQCIGHCQNTGQQHLADVALWDGSGGDHRIVNQPSLESKLVKVSAC